MTARTALLLLLLLAPAARADEALGMQLVREAQARLAGGDAEGAILLLDRARTEWPGSDVVACTRGDALLAAGRHDEALLEYERALSGRNAHHAHFNRGVGLAGAAEQMLEQAGVPADAAALPEGPQPGMLQAVQAARPRLDQARDEFLGALDREDEPAARESLGALNRRLDALAAIEEELRRREEQPPQPDENQDQQQDQPQPRPGDQPPPEGEPQSQEGQPPGDQPPEPQEGSQEEPPPDGSQEPQPGEPESSDASQPEGAAPPPVRELSEEEVERLLDRLAQLEAEARAHAKAREAASRRAVEKDW